MSSTAIIPSAEASPVSLSPAPASNSFKKNERKKRKHPHTRLKYNIAKCSVCKENESKYKCPKCRESYCSVACCKTHKTKCLVLRNNSITTNETSKDSIVNKSPSKSSKNAFKYKVPPNYTLRRNKKRFGQNMDHDELEEEQGWNITPEMKEAIKNSEWIRSELADGGLQSIINDIVNSEDGWRGRNAALAEAKSQCPLFAKFVDQVLLTASIIQKEENVRSDGNIEQGFILTPTPSKRNIKNGELKGLLANEECSILNDETKTDDKSRSDEESCIDSEYETSSESEVL